MEDNKKQILHGECPRKLNLNVPPLSTRRPSTLPKSNATSNAAVPFSWERIPGEPKDKDGTNDDSIDMPPPPRPPPGWRVPPVTSDGRCCDYYDGVSDAFDDGCEKYGRNERLSDANIDIFSLAESTDDMELEAEYEKAIKRRSSEVMCPNFIIERFLPDAQALAEASVTNKKFSFLSSPDLSASTLSRGVGIGRSYDSSKGCGLGSFLPWRMKPKPCSDKSPVCDTIIGANQKRNG